MPTYYLRLSVLLTLVAGFPAYPQATRPPLHPVVHRQAAGSGATTSGEDRRIEASIRARFAQSKIGTNKFEVHVQGGIATLEGHAEVAQHKGTATRLAKSAGALAVVNRIEISEAARQRAAANLAKGRRRVQVKRGEARSLAAGR